MKPSTPRQQPSKSPEPKRRCQLRPLQVPLIDANPKLPDIRDLIGPSIPANPNVEPEQAVPPAPTIARLLTPQSELKPPYPESKLLTGEEATLTLRLSINEQGRVVGVDPLGTADRAFLEAARRYLIAHWRYKPATRDGQPSHQPRRSRFGSNSTDGSARLAERARGDLSFAHVLLPHAVESRAKRCATCSHSCGSEAASR